MTARSRKPGGSYIEPPFHANFGGRHCHFGKRIYAIYNLTCAGNAHICVGDHAMTGPNVTIATAAHPPEAAPRQQGPQFNRPVHIGRSCQLGAGVIVLPGITIGDNVVGAGSIVTKDLPDNVVVVGNPCRILRHINTEEESQG